jgi:hypothetical protein
MCCEARLECRSSAAGDELCIKIALCRFEPVAGESLGWCRKRRQPKDLSEGMWKENYTPSEAL